MLILERGRIIMIIVSTKDDLSSTFDIMWWIRKQFGSIQEREMAYTYRLRKLTNTAD